MWCSHEVNHALSWILGPTISALRDGRGTSYTTGVFPAVVAAVVHARTSRGSDCRAVLAVAYQSIALISLVKRATSALAGLILLTFVSTLGAWQFGRASCRDRVCQYVLISVVVVSLKKKK